MELSEPTLSASMAHKGWFYKNREETSPRISRRTLHSDITLCSHVGLGAPNRTSARAIISCQATKTQTGSDRKGGRDSPVSTGPQALEPFGLKGWCHVVGSILNGLCLTPTSLCSSELLLIPFEIQLVLFISFFETYLCCYIVQASLSLTMEPRLVLNLW